MDSPEGNIPVGWIAGWAASSFLPSFGFSLEGNLSMCLPNSGLFFNWLNIDLKSRLSGFEKHNKVLHGDFQLSNVMIDNSGKVFIVDWAHATQGNASADVAMSYLLMKMDKMDDLAEKYLNLFCEKTNTDKHYVQTWVPIVAGAHLMKCKPENREILENFINVVQY